MLALLCLCCGVYMMIRGRDNQENMARLYDSFQRYSQDTPFVSTFEKYQREVVDFSVVKFWKHILELG